MAKPNPRLVGLLLAGFPVISLDNVNGELGSDLLCQAVERPLVRLRALGRSDILEIESRATLFATGNNLRVRGDMTRRTLVCTSIQAWNARSCASSAAGRSSGCWPIAGATSPPLSPSSAPTSCAGRRPSQTNRLIRRMVGPGASALVWLGCADPAASMETARAEDPELSELREVLVLWRDAFGMDWRVSCRDLADKASERWEDDRGNRGAAFPGLHDALQRIAGEAVRQCEAAGQRVARA